MRTVRAGSKALRMRSGQLYTLREDYFGDAPRYQLVGPPNVDQAQIYGLLRAVASEE